jgi:hypothetical protein
MQKKQRPSAVANTNQPKQQNTRHNMSYSQGKFAAFFFSGLKIVKTDGGHIRVYARSVNQNATYYLMSRGQIIHCGKRKHIMAMFRRYVPVAVDSYMQA